MIKIFLVYHKPFEIFKTDTLTPIQSGCALANFDLGVLKDNIGKNISEKNKNYGELTCWYWVWKNYLPIHPELDYIGFGHYRRVLAFPNLKQKRDVKKIYTKDFLSLLPNYTQNVLINEIADYDIVLFEKTIGALSVEEDYKSRHPNKDFDNMKNLILSRYPEYESLVNDFLFGRDVYFRLNFVMKRRLFEDFMDWIFPLLFDLEKQSDWSEYNDYFEVRTPAFLAEIFFNVWLRIQMSKNPKLKIKENKLYLILNNLPLKYRFLRKVIFLLPKQIRDKLRAKIERM